MPESAPATDPSPAKRRARSDDTVVLTVRLPKALGERLTKEAEARALGPGWFITTGVERLLDSLPPIPGA